MTYGVLVAAGSTYRVLYSSRASITDDFPAMQELASVPAGGQYPFLSSDCSRMYFSGLSSILYVQQQ